MTEKKSKTNRRLFIVLDPDVLIRRVTLILIEGDDVGGGGIVALSHQVIPCSCLVMMMMVMVKILVRKGLGLTLLSLSAPNYCCIGGPVTSIGSTNRSLFLHGDDDYHFITVPYWTASTFFPLPLLLFRGLQSSNGVAVISASFLSPSLTKKRLWSHY